MTATVRNVTTMRLVIHHKFLFYSSMRRILNGEVMRDVQVDGVILQYMYARILLNIFKTQTNFIFMAITDNIVNMSTPHLCKGDFTMLAVSEWSCKGKVM